MPNFIAYLMLFGWPIISLIMFKKMRSPERALIATMIWGYLLLPTGLDFKVPVLPPLNRTMLPSLCALAFFAFFKRQEQLRHRLAARRQVRLGQRPPIVADISPTPFWASGEKFWIGLCVALLTVLSFVTYQTNTLPVLRGPVSAIPGLRPYDIGAQFLSILFTLLPFYLARRYLVSSQARMDFLRLLAWGTFIYSFGVLIEWRLSFPIFNQNIYGFFQGDWLQQKRDGAFRSIMFLEHGLRVGMIQCLGILATATLARLSRAAERKKWICMILWLFLTLYISKNLGATLIAIILVPTILFAPLRLQTIVAACLSVIVLLYPMARGSGLVPANTITQWVSSISAQRAQSFNFRLENEDILLARANEKPLAGWGGWGRNRVYDPESGRDLSITDGTWVIIIGTYGWIGYLGFFGLLCLPAILMWKRRKILNPGPLETGLLLMLCANLVDLIPNSSFLPMLWLMAGLAWAQLARPVTEPLPDTVALRRNRRAATEAQPARPSTVSPRLTRLRTSR